MTRSALAALAVSLALTAQPALAGGVGTLVELTGGTAERLPGSMDGQASIRFVRVIEDNRCPSSVTCVWAKPPVVDLAIAVAGTEARTVSLVVPGAWTTAAPGIRIRPIRLLPAPLEPQDFGRIRPIGDYRLTIEVRADD